MGNSGIHQVLLRWQDGRERTVDHRPQAPKTVVEAGRYLGLSSSSIRALIKAGKLHGWKQPNPHGGAVAQRWLVCELCIQQLVDSGKLPHGRGVPGWAAPPPPSDDRTVVIPPPGMQKTELHRAALTFWPRGDGPPEWLDIETPADAKRWEQWKRHAAPEARAELERQLQREETVSWFYFPSGGKKRDEQTIAWIKQQLRELDRFEGAM